MRRTITSVSVWLAVTAVAVAMSWWGVRSVLRDTVFEAPRAPTLTADEEPLPSRTSPPPSIEPALVPDLISATNRTTAAPPPSPKPPTSAPPSTAAAPSTPAAPAVPAAPDTTPPIAAGTSKPDGFLQAQGGRSVQSFEIRGGRASFRFGPTSATLVAATPNSGWAVKVWPNKDWIRVDFTNGSRTSTVIVAWNNHEPIATTHEA